MKRLTIDKLIYILEDCKENDIAFIDYDQMEGIYRLYGDDAYYDRDFGRMEVVRIGQDYIKINDRK